MMGTQNTVSGERLRGFVERLESIQQRKKDCGADERVIMAEAAAEGLTPKIIRHCLKVRAAKPSDVQETNALVDVYLSALGLAPEPPLFRAMGLMSVDTAMRDSVIEAMKKFVPANGAIVIESEGRPVRLTRGPDGAVTVAEIIEKLKPEKAPGSSTAPSREKPPVPDVDAAGAEKLGWSAAKADQPVISNPFPFGDARRAMWDKGWRSGAGSDGMGPEG